MNHIINLHNYAVKSDFPFYISVQYTRLISKREFYGISITSLIKNLFLNNMNYSRHSRIFCDWIFISLLVTDIFCIIVKCRNNSNNSLLLFFLVLIFLLIESFFTNFVLLKLQVNIIFKYYANWFNLNCIEKDIFVWNINFI